MNEPTLVARLSKAERTIRQKDAQIAALQSERDTLRNRLAGGTSAEAGELRAKLQASESDLRRSEDRRKALQAQVDEYGAALDEAGDAMLKAGVPVPIEGYRGAPIRLAGDVLSLLNEKLPVESAS